jgi:hypothetical protein
VETEYDEGKDAGEQDESARHCMPGLWVCDGGGCRVGESKGRKEDTSSAYLPSLYSSPELPPLALSLHTPPPSLPCISRMQEHTLSMLCNTPLSLSHSLSLSLPLPCSQSQNGWSSSNEWAQRQPTGAAYTSATAQRHCSALLVGLMTGEPWKSHNQLPVNCYPLLGLPIIDGGSWRSGLSARDSNPC